MNSLKEISKKAHKKFVDLRKVFADLRTKTVVGLHQKLIEKWTWYANWHSDKRSHKIHWAVTLSSVVGLITLVTLQQTGVWALSDLFDYWNFSNPASYTVSSGAIIENNGAKLQEQEYQGDANTVGLYHFNELNGSVATDSLSMHNNMTVSNGNFGSGIIHNSLQFNGLNTKGVVNSSP